MADGKAVTGVILAGGLARRMGDGGGGDKALLQLGGKPILSHVIARAQTQTDCLVINANGPAERFARFDLPVVSDPIDGFAGPLAGVLAGMDWACEHSPEAKWIVTVACDTPFFPTDLVDRLLAEINDKNADMACAASGGRHHPVFGLWPVRLADELRHALIDEEIRKVDLWTARYRLAVSEFSNTMIDPFFNVNRPEDLGRAEEIIAEKTS